MSYAQRSSGPHAAAAETPAARASASGRLAELSALKRRVPPKRPPIVWSLSLLLAFKSLVAFAVVVSPLSAEQPSVLLAAGGAVTLAGALYVWLLGSRIPMVGFELLVAVAVLTASGLVADARSTGGMMVAAFAYPWVAIYAAHFFPRRVVNALGVAVSVAFAAGLAINGLPHAGIYWFVVTATVWSVCIVLGGISEGLRRQIGTDELTGVLNRTGFTAAAQRERAVADRTRTPLSVAALDLDEFKQINDWAGHATGDRLLATLASDWRERLRPGDILARQGGDEFVLLLPSTSAPEAEAAIARLRGDVDLVGWSVGIAEWLRGEELSTVLARADARLYDAKLAKLHSSPGPGRRSLSRLAAAGAVIE